MALHESLKTLREKANLTQEEVAAILGIKRTAYASYETGRIKIDIELLQKLAKHYSVTIDSILTGNYLDVGINITQPEESFFGVSTATLIAMEAALKVLTKKLIEEEIKRTKKDKKTVSQEFHKAMKEEYNQLLQGLQKK